MTAKWSPLLTVEIRIVLRPRRPSALIALMALAAAIPGIGHADPSALGIRRPCDSLDQALCLLPFPNDYFTRPDPSTPTGLRVDILPVEMPRVGGVKPIDPTEWNRQDGFSP